MCFIEDEGVILCYSSLRVLYGLEYRSQWCCQCHGHIRWIRGVVTSAGCGYGCCAWVFRGVSHGNSCDEYDAKGDIGCWCVSREGFIAFCWVAFFSGSCWDLVAGLIAICSSIWILSQAWLIEDHGFDCVFLIDSWNFGELEWFQFLELIECHDWLDILRCYAVVF